MSVIIEVSPNTFEETGIMEHISRLKICYRDIAYTLKRKHKCSVLPHEIWRIPIIGQYRNAFLAYSFRSRKQVQKYEKYFIRQKIFLHVREKVYLCSAFGTDVARMKRYIYIVLGLLAVGLGTLGVVVPGLPTTPFLLLASWLFYRSSPRLQQWLLRSWLGKYIRGYQRRGGMTATQKAGAVGVMTVMVLLSTFAFIPAGSVARIIVPVAGGVGALTVVFLVPNAKSDE